MILVDTSALAKLLVEEAESSSLRDALAASSNAGEEFAISTLAMTELRRLIVRLDIDSSLIEPVIRPFRVLRVTEGILQLAGRFPYRNLGTLDAVHLATALTAEASAVATYDRRLAEAAEAEGLGVLRPEA
ncbi:type II toxin-antitoxin system VapC family toxin [Microbacterium sp. NIBRBAC000506063]|uniref:type II toxin-antitoxin system VapC family toxin n=1 Tax=Microbacterium sp. NIBRBAC000506063 TaxID=2734618 RepID=UPI001BB50CC7|nr:type II toxin-antitoxin system VapC family toxin [Microbacterium sp. NIBRBAC000506063]QTV80150.1 type II toxin-antitoxin system VapC family toxin [Microbacterium sp. NIBRBAC000506063]